MSSSRIIDPVDEGNSFVILLYPILMNQLMYYDHSSSQT